MSKIDLFCLIKLTIYTVYGIQGQSSFIHDIKAKNVEVSHFLFNQDLQSKKIIKSIIMNSQVIYVSI